MRKTSRTSWLWLAPFLVFALVFGLYPLAQVVRMAFSDVAIREGQFMWTWTGADGLIRVLSEGASWQSIGNTIVFVAATVIGSIVVGTVLALLVDRAVTLLPLARNMLIWPAIVAPVVVSLIWLLILSPTAGGLNKVLRSIGLADQQWLNSPTGAMSSVIIVDIWHWTPVVFLFIYTALKTLDPAMLEAARVDGASELQIFRMIVLPLLVPALGAVAAIRVIMGIKAFDEMYLITAGGPQGATTLISMRIKELFVDQLRLGEAAAFGMFIVVITAIGLGIVLYRRSRREKKEASR